MSLLHRVLSTGPDTLQRASKWQLTPPPTIIIMGTVVPSWGLAEPRVLD